MTKDPFSRFLSSIVMGFLGPNKKSSIIRLRGKSVIVQFIQMSSWDEVSHNGQGLLRNVMTPQTMKNSYSFAMLKDVDASFDTLKLSTNLNIRNMILMKTMQLLTTFP